MKTLHALFIIVLAFGVAFFALRVMKTEAPGQDGVAIDEGTDGRVRAPEDLTLAVGESGTALGGLTLTFNALLNDYRCPTDVQCIEAGAVNTNITVSTAEKTETLNYSSDGVPLTFEGYSISIIAVSPNAHSQKVIAPEEYVVTFHVESAFSGIVDTVLVGDSGNQCASIGGTWDPTFSECLGVDANSCQEIGGVFNECASACRNDPTAEVCTMQCVQICQIGTSGK